jgi:hypothetical protein
MSLILAVFLMGADIVVVANNASSGSYILTAMQMSLRHTVPRETSDVLLRADNTSPASLRSSITRLDGFRGPKWHSSVVYQTVVAPLSCVEVSDGSRIRVNVRTIGALGLK